MKNFRILLHLLLYSTTLYWAQAVPPMFNYAGQIAVQGEPFAGKGLFKFAIVNDRNATITSYWSNDGTSTAGSEPDANVSVQVDGGLYSILLGNASIPGMSALNPAIFSSQANLKLRVWFSDGVNGFQHLAPDRAFASVPYALNAGSVHLAPGSISRSMLASGVLAELNATIPKSRLASDIINDLNATIGKNRLSSEILSDLNTTITRSRLAADILADLNRTITQNMLDPGLQSKLFTKLSSTVSGDHNVTAEQIVLASQEANSSIRIYLPTAVGQDGRSIRFLASGKSMRLDALNGEMNGSDWTQITGNLELIANQGIWYPFGSNPPIMSKGMLKDIYPGTSSSYPFNFTEFNNTLFFRANDVNGSEIWKTDGTEAGTVRVRDIWPGTSSSSPSNFTEFKGKLLFSARDSNGTELWKTDGTEAGTARVKDIWPGTNNHSYPSNFTEFNGTLLFSARDSNGTELWKTDGTEPGTVRVRDIYPGTSSSSPSNFTEFNGTLFFRANDVNGTELWKTDGTEAGTVRIKDIWPGTNNHSYPSNFTEFNGTLLFSARDSNGTELWKTDGTEAGTVRIKDIWPGTNNHSYPSNFTEFNGTLFFRANDVNGTELWKTDGTEAGTVRVRDIYPGTSSSSPYNFTEFKGKLLFTARDSNGTELWKTDGTEAGTVRVRDIYPGTDSSNPMGFTDLNGTLLFNAQDINGNELWKTDGTEAGTVRVKDIWHGTSPSHYMYEAGYFKSADKIYFSANDGKGGGSSPWNNLELWKSDGTEAGTKKAKEIYHGANGSNPSNFIMHKGKLFFTANDPMGNELWMIDPNE